MNQWEYCSYKDGVADYLEYDDRERIWGTRDGVCIGIDFQRGIDGTFASRNWTCPSKGKYRIIFAAECEIGTDVYMILNDEEELFGNHGSNHIHCENTVQLQEKSIVRFLNSNGYIRKVNIEIKKMTEV